MANLIFVSENGGLGFGDYTLAEKSKLSDFPHLGDLYKVKTFAEITKLERNGSFVYESVPGTKVEGFKEEDRKISFAVEGDGNTQITLDLEEEKEYRVLVDRNKKPAHSPARAGTHSGTGRQAERSMAGISRLQTEAAVMTPAAKPLRAFCLSGTYSCRPM